MNKVLLPLLVLLIISCSVNQSNDVESDKSDSTASWIDQQVTEILEKENIPSISIATIQNGEPALLKGYGVLNRKGTANSNENTVYQIASVSKMFTGTIANHLLKEGIIDLDEKIVSYLPEDLSTSNKEKLGDIKLRHLMHHRSGLPRDSKVVKRVDGEPFLGGYTEDDLLKDLDVLELEFNSNEKYSYSNIGYGLLGYILERASGKSYEVLLNEYITDPLEMNNTEANPANIDKKITATPYRKDDRNTPTKAWESGKLVPAGGLYSTTEDLSKLMVHQIQDYAEYEKTGSASNFIITEFKAPRKSEIESYGFGLIEVNTERGNIYGHQGDMDGFASSYLFFPKYKVGVILLTSSGGDWLGKLSSEILKKLVEEAKQKG
ncbi:serine hydrolase domain-containing protein [Mangrovivirga cuniculi]|uniref:Beta-lactamase-related domain-containing protein n=1 Tax=Mangrovivirga cuniculi TaxID=2715131 RepID=A0A4D7JJB1_9BACT|nr:serine hydrolase domain-containing protein [Mangrovivirga cuniculi]QCK15681.1 hypothetical protein DCC35_13470 [Mangrovivirga cuniculi]